ncbi:MAG: 2-dehydropantoate 2-reductase [Candidatus Omnitrophota bacterium]
MKIAIVGPGAIGSLFASFISKVHQDIWLIDKKELRVKLIQEKGIIVEGVSGKHQAKVNITCDLAQVGKVDLLVIAVKAYDTKQAIEFSRSLVGEDSLVLTLQNGIGNAEIISEAVGQEKVIVGVTNQGATLISDGHINHAGIGETIIGRIDGKIPVQLRQIREIFNKAGFETRISRDIKGILWSKLIINVGINAITAITRLNNGKITEFEGTRRVLESAVNEAVKVAKKKRIKLIYDDPLAKVEAVCEATSTNISSMLQDVLKNKKTEIDFINGAITRQAQNLGIPTPVNNILVDLIKTIEATYALQLT